MNEFITIIYICIYLFVAQLSQMLPVFYLLWQYNLLIQQWNWMGICISTWYERDGLVHTKWNTMKMCRTIIDHIFTSYSIPGIRIFWELKDLTESKKHKSSCTLISITTDHSVPVMYVFRIYIIELQMPY